MRLRIPHWLRLISVLLVVLLLVTTGLIYGVRAAQPVPYCLIYQKQTQAWYVQTDARDGQAQTMYRDYLTRFDYAMYGTDVSPNGRAFMRLAQSGYGGPDALFAGMPNGEKMIEVADEYYMEGGWSPDGSAYAFVYNDDLNYIAVTDAAGKHKRVQAFTEFELGGFPHFGGWSADGTYLASMTFGDGEVANYYFIASDTLQPMPTSITAYGLDYRQVGSLVWSPHGHRFAYIERTGEQYNLVIATPEQGTEQRFALAEPDEWYLQLPVVWSPDGRYVSLHRATTIKHGDSFWEYWAYSIFGVDGSKHTGIKGQKNNLGDFEKTPDGWWSADSSTWYFRQHPYVEGAKETGEEVLSYIMGYHIATGTYHRLAEHVADSPLVLDGRERVVVPVWNNDTLDIALISTADTTRSTLVTDAALKPKPRLVWSAASNGGTVAAIWYRMTATGQRIALLTWVNADGTTPHTIDQKFDEITELHWLDDQRSVLYIAYRGKEFIVGIVNLATGDTIHIDGLMDDSGANLADSWSQIRRLFASPSGQQLILKVGKWDQQTLYLISLADQKITRLEAEPSVFGDVQWALDGTMFAFIQYDYAQTMNDTLRIIAADGKVLREMKLLRSGTSDRSNNLFGWNWCR